MRIAVALVLGVALATRLGLSGLAGGGYGEFSEDEVRDNVDRYLHAVFCEPDSEEARAHADLRAGVEGACPVFEVRELRRPSDTSRPFLITVRSRKPSVTLDLTHARSPEAGATGLVRILGTRDEPPVDH